MYLFFQLSYVKGIFETLFNLSSYSFQNLYRQLQILVCHHLAGLTLIAASKRIIRYVRASVVCLEHRRIVDQNV